MASKLTYSIGGGSQTLGQRLVSAVRKAIQNAKTQSPKNVVTSPNGPPPGSRTQTNNNNNNSPPSSNNKYYDPYAAERARQAAEKAAKEKKEADAAKKAVDALHSQLGGLATARGKAIANIDLREKQGRDLIDRAFENLSLTLDGSLRDNEKAEHDSSFHNRANRGRERMDILSEAASQGAGETDTLRSQAMALRNWAANQSEVNRSFHDTQRSVNSEITNLNETTKQNLHNLYGQSNVDRAKAWDDYYRSTADIWTQIFNTENAMHANKQYTVQYADAAKKAASAVGGKWTDPGIPQNVQDWQGKTTEEKMLNSSNFDLQDYGSHITQKKPEGGTLRKW